MLAILTLSTIASTSDSLQSKQSTNSGADGIYLIYEDTDRTKSIDDILAHADSLFFSLKSRAYAYDIVNDERALMKLDNIYSASFIVFNAIMLVILMGLLIAFVIFKDKLFAVYGALVACALAFQWFLAEIFLILLIKK